MKFNLKNSSPAVEAALINAAARVYAGGLIGSNYSPEDMRRAEARKAVADFFETLEQYNAEQLDPPSA